MKPFDGLEPANLDSITKTVRQAFHPLRVIRESQGLSLTDLSKSADVYRWTIHYIEIMRVKPTPKTVYKLAVSLGVNPAQLYVSILEYGMENIQSPHARTLRIVAQPGETPKQMIARLLHRQLHPFYRGLIKLDISANDFLKNVNISKTTIKNWMDGKCTPNTVTLTKLGDAYDMTLDEILEQVKQWNAEDLSDPVVYIEENIHRLDV